MPTFSFTSKNGVTDFTTYYPETIDLSKSKYEAALIELTTYNSIPNIKRNVNNIFTYSSDNGATWKEITLNVGSYEHSDIINEIERQMIENGDYDMTNDKFYIVIEPNMAELKSIITITNDAYQVKFGGKHSIGKVLGFPTAITLISGRHLSPKPVDITPVNSILVNTDLVNGRWFNNQHSSIIYSFAPPVGPGLPMIIVPRNLNYLPISQFQISSIRVWLTDQNQRPLTNRDETLVVVIDVREVKENRLERAFTNAMKSLQEK